MLPRSRGGLSTTENCVPACLACNGRKSDTDAFDWYRRQRFYDPRRAMAIRAWMDGDLRLALRLLQWASPQSSPTTGLGRPGPGQALERDGGRQGGRGRDRERGRSGNGSTGTGGEPGWVFQAA